MRVPPRVIHFIWRCVCGALPFADTLERRGVSIDDACPFCEVGPSRAIHLFFECRFARDIWRLAGLDQKIDAEMSTTSQQTFVNLLLLPDFHCDLFGIICYMIWYYRNKAIFEGVKIDEVLIFRSSATLLTDYNNCNAWPERFPDSLNSKMWKRPPTKGTRVFFDGATSRLSAGGTGVFVSDETGQFFHGDCRFYGGINDPLVLEMLALRDALRLARRLGLHSFSLLGDSQEAILAANGERNVPVLYALSLKI